MWKFPRSLFMTLLIIIHHRGIQGCQYLSTDLGTPSSVQLHPYSVLCIAGGFHVAEDPNYMSQKMNRAISRYWKVDSFPFDWPSFPRSSSRHHPLNIPVVPVYHHVSTSSLPETAARGKGRKVQREASILWYRKNQSVEHGDWWNTAQRNSEPWYLR
jgi:hypothetical protein